MGNQNGVVVEDSRVHSGDLVHNHAVDWCKAEWLLYRSICIYAPTLDSDSLWGIAPVYEAVEARFVANFLIPLQQDKTGEYRKFS